MKNFMPILNHDVLVKANPYKVINYHDKNIIVVPSSGAWVI